MSRAEPLLESGSKLRPALERLGRLSEAGYYNPYTRFAWPESLPHDRFWMSPELLTVYGTHWYDDLDEERLMRLSRMESVHFYSLNIHGIRDLIADVVRRIHTTDYDPASSFFHHFIGEENEHMWFFAEFCRRYGDGILPDKRMSFGAEVGDHAALVDFLTFARILIFEELVDYFNVRMGQDERLPAIVREINAAHHQDEARHVAAGRRIVAVLWSRAAAGCPAETLSAARSYIARYREYSLGLLYNPSVYREAGLPSPFALRRELLQSDARREQHDRFLEGSDSFFSRILRVRPGTGAP